MTNETENLLNRKTGKDNSAGFVGGDHGPDVRLARGRPLLVRRERGPKTGPT